MFYKFYALLVSVCVYVQTDVLGLFFFFLCLLQIGWEDNGDSVLPTGIPLTKEAMSNGLVMSLRKRVRMNMYYYVMSKCFKSILAWREIRFEIPKWAV